MGVRKIALSKMASKEEINHSKSLKYSSPAHKAGVSYLEILTISRGNPTEKKVEVDAFDAVRVS